MTNKERLSVKHERLCRVRDHLDRAAMELGGPLVQAGGLDDALAHLMRVRVAVNEEAQRVYAAYERLPFREAV